MSSLSASHFSGSDSGERDTVLSAMASALAAHKAYSSPGGGVVSNPLSLESSLDEVASLMDSVSLVPSGTHSQRKY